MAVRSYFIGFGSSHFWSIRWFVGVLTFGLNSKSITFVILSFRFNAGHVIKPGRQVFHRMRDTNSVGKPWRSRTLILPHTRQRQTRWFTSGLSLTRVLSWISAKPIVYRLFSILNSDLIHNNLCFYNVWIYSRSHSATRIIRAACYRKFYFDFPSPLLAYSPLAKPARVPLTQLIPLFHTRIHTFNIVSLLLA